LPPPAPKRVVLYRFDRVALDGYASSGDFAKGETLELMTSRGSLQMVPYSEVKALCFVSQTGDLDLFSDHMLFERRPKMPGLWVRFTFRDGDRLDGILSHNLLEWPENGYLITPPRPGATRRLVFLPKAALTQTELRGVIGKSPGGPKRPSKKSLPPGEGQLSIFDS
jgi:hypothetical protein